MAKRKRLTPAPVEAEHIPTARGASPSGSSLAAGVPIARVAGEAAGLAAVEEMAQAMETAREEGRWILSLPLEAVVADHLVRDRIVVDIDEMDALRMSLDARGQQTPIEVTPLSDGRYGLISGWRRLTALGQLHADTGEARFATVDAILRHPETAAGAYLAMVEENEIRAGLSHYERARIVVRAVEENVFPDHAQALRGLFASASRPRRSKIGSFVSVVRALDGRLRFPRALGERLGLKLAKALETDPTFGSRLAEDLTANPAGDAAEEQSRIAKALAPDRPADPKPETHAPVQGVTLTTHPDGRIVLKGPRVDAALTGRLTAWLRDAF